MDLDDRLRTHLAAAGDRIPATGGDVDRVTRRAHRRTVRNRVGGAALAVALVAGGTGLALTLGDDGSDTDTEVAVADATPSPTATPEPSPGVIVDAPPPGGTAMSSLEGVRHLTATADGYVAVGAPTNAERGLWSTTDGTTWVSVALPARGISVTDLVWYDGTLLLTGTRDDGIASTPVAFTSTDLTTWAEVPLTIDLPAGSPALVWAPELTHVAAGPSGTLALGSAHAELDLAAVAPEGVPLDGGWFFGSPVGEDVVSVADPDTGDVVWSSPLADLGFTQQEIDGLIRGQGLPVVVRFDGSAGASVPATGLDDAAVHRLAATADGFVASGTRVSDGVDAVWTSADGSDWTAVAVPTGADPALGALTTDDTVWLVGTTPDSAGPTAWSAPDAASWSPTDLSGLIADPGRRFVPEAADARDGTVVAVYAAVEPQVTAQAEPPADVVVTDGAYTATVDLVSGVVTVTGPGDAVVATFADWLLQPNAAITTGQADPPPNVPAPDGPEPPSLPADVERDDAGGFVLTDDQGAPLASFPALLAQVDQRRSEWQAEQPAAQAAVPDHHWLVAITAGADWQARSLDDLLADGEWVQTVGVRGTTALLAIATPPTDEEIAAYEERQEQLTSGAADNPTVLGPAPTIRFVQVSLG